MAISNEEIQLIEKRFEQWNEKLGIANLRIGELTKDEMLEHVKAKDEIGRNLVEVQLSYLRKLKLR